ncbi:MAG: SH3 domain-containing protein, partial [Thermomicrobiales bacterium]
TQPPAPPTLAPRTNQQPTPEPAVTQADGTDQPTGSDGSTTTAVTTDILNLRSGPSTDADIVAQIPAGEAVTITEGEAQNGFVSVIWQDVPGWVAEEFLDYGAAPVEDPNSP